MSPQARALIGAVTTVVFVGLGALLVADGRTLLGAVVVVLGLFRGWVAFDQWRATE